MMEYKHIQIMYVLEKHTKTLLRMFKVFASFSIQQLNWRQELAGLISVWQYGNFVILSLH